jgi:hypothetical protein
MSIMEGKVTLTQAQFFSGEGLDLDLRVVEAGSGLVSSARVVVY